MVLKEKRFLIFLQKFVNTISIAFYLGKIPFEDNTAQNFGAWKDNAELLPLGTWPILDVDGSYLFFLRDFRVGEFSFLSPRLHRRCSLYGIKCYFDG